jgi:hypothetical protein
MSFTDYSDAARQHHIALWSPSAGSGRSNSPMLIKVDQGDVVPTSRHSFYNDRIALEFHKHERKWRRETIHVSSPYDKYLHPSYARIIGLGWPAAKLILESLQRRPADWFYALRAITGENPVPPSFGLSGGRSEA